MPDRHVRPWALLGLVVLAALLLRLGHVASVFDSPLNGTLTLDSRHYHEEAQRILGKLPADEPAGPGFMNVGYPYFIAAVYALAGSKPVVAIGLQTLVGALTAACLALFVLQASGSRAAGLIAGLLFAAYAPGVFYDGLLLTPSLTNLFTGAALLLFARYQATGVLRHLALCGLAIGVATFLRSNMILLLPALAPLALFGRTGPRPSRRHVPVIVLLCAALLLPGAVVLRNGLAYGEWVLSANAGMNFWAGNHRDASGVYGAGGMVGSQSPEQEKRVFLERARVRTGNPGLSLAGSSSYWLGEGLREIAAAPGRWLGLEMRKLGLYFSRHEAKTNVSMAFIEEFSPLLAWLPVRFGLLVVLGAGGIAWLFRNGRGELAGVALAPVLVSLATCLAFFVSGEYRHPASLGLCAGAGVLLAAVGQRLARRPVAENRLGIAAIVALLFVPLVLRSEAGRARASHPFLDYSNYARAICTGGVDGKRPDREDFRRATELLDHARVEERKDKQLFLLDARLWVEFLASMELRDQERAGRAFDVAGRIVADLARRPRGYSASFLRHLGPSVTKRVARLAGQPFVRADPELSRKAEALLARSGGAP